MKRLKIAFFTGIFPALTESWLVEQATSLIDLGVEIDFFAYDKGNPEHVSEIIQKYHILENITYLEFPQNKIEKIFKAIPLIFKVFFHDPSTALHIMTGRFGSPLLTLFWTAPLIGKMGKYDVIHCHFGIVGNRFLMAKRILGIRKPLVVSILGLDSKRYIQLKGIEVYDQLKKECDYFFMLTEEMKQRFMQLGFPKNKLVVLYGGVNPDRYTFTEKKYTPGDLFNIIFVGRFVQKKGIDDAIRAIKIVYDQFPLVRFHIIGAGAPAYTDYLKKLVKELHIEHAVIFEGMVPHVETLERYSLPDTHILFQPSRTGDDGDTDDMPFVLLEAQLCGVPVITTDHAGIPEALLDGETGFIVAQRDYHAAAEKIIHLIKNPELLPRMGRAGREFVINKFDLKVIDVELIDLYHLLARSKT